jgi:hypothetical protein
MKSRSLSARGLAALALGLAVSWLLAGCGGGDHSPGRSSLPLVKGARVVTSVRQCDQGANAYCTLELVVVDRDYKSARDFVVAERDLLKRQGWSTVAPPTADELAAESPGHKLRITYATAYGDLKGIDLGWLQRSLAVRRSLGEQLVAGAPALSALVQSGSQ